MMTHHVCTMLVFCIILCCINDILVPSYISWIQRLNSSRLGCCQVSRHWPSLFLTLGVSETGPITHTQQQQLDRQSLSLELKRETYWPSWVIFCPCIFHDKSILRNCWIPPITQIIWNDPPFNRWLDSLTISPWFQVKLDSLSLSSPDWVKIGSKTHLASYKSIWKRKTIEGKARVGFAREGLETWNSFRKKLIWSISN